MKKIILLSLVSMILTSPLKVPEIDMREIEDMIDIVSENNLPIDQWEVTIKEKIKVEEKQDIIESIKTNGIYTRKKSGNSVLYSFGDSHISPENVEIYIVLIPTNKSNELEVIAVFKGHTWNEEIMTNYAKWLRGMMDNVFTKSARKYTCLTTEFNDIMNDDYVLDYITENLDIKHKQTQIDKNKKSTLDNVFYGYTSLWSQKVDVMDRPINVQIAVAKNEMGMVKYTIGTPILINEY